MKKMFQMLFLLLSISFISCNAQQEPTSTKTSSFKDKLNPEGNTLEKRIPTPDGFERIPVKTNSYSSYLRTIPLKPHGAEVNYYDGRQKANRNIYTAVVDMEIGQKDLHQCADAIMRLKAEYLWKSGQYDKIHFNFTNGFRVDYKEWMKGRRMIVKGNKTYWDNGSRASNSYQDFWAYMELIFMYAGTASLEKELKSVALTDMQIGDVFIKGGHPGHAVVVMDMAENKTTGQKIYLLAQSYMPAQETQILVNRMNSKLSPWYEIRPQRTINTPEWSFEPHHLRRFVD